MAYAKAWKVHTSKLEDLIDSADTEGYCMIEVYSDSSDSISSCDLWMKMSSGWVDDDIIEPPVIPIPD